MLLLLLLVVNIFVSTFSQTNTNTISANIAKPNFEDIYCFLKNRNFDTKIINGEEAVPHAYPYQVGIITEDNNGNVYLCGGSLISTTEVLTAAHCLTDIIQTTLYFGFHNIDEEVTDNGRQILQSTTFSIHPDYSSTQYTNDIGIIKLTTSVKLNDFVDITKLDNSTEDHARDEGIVTGWGITKFNSEASPVLRFVTNEIITNDECIKSGQGELQNIIQPSHICLSNANNRGICSGDSGGPLVSSGVQIGIASFGPKMCHTDYPAVFMRINSYIDWIKENCRNCKFSSSDSSQLNVTILFVIFVNLIF